MNNELLKADDDWLKSTIDLVINGKKDAFSQRSVSTAFNPIALTDSFVRLGQECQPESFPDNVPQEPLFDTEKVAIVSNGR